MGRRRTVCIGGRGPVGCGGLAAAGVDERVEHIDERGQDRVTPGPPRRWDAQGRRAVPGPLRGGDQRPVLAAHLIGRAAGERTHGGVRWAAPLGIIHRAAHHGGGPDRGGVPVDIRRLPQHQNHCGFQQARGGDVQGWHQERRALDADDVRGAEDLDDPPRQIRRRGAAARPPLAGIRPLGHVLRPPPSWRLNARASPAARSWSERPPCRRSPGRRGGVPPRRPSPAARSGSGTPGRCWHAGRRRSSAGAHCACVVPLWRDRKWSHLISCHDRNRAFATLSAALMVRVAQE